MAKRIVSGLGGFRVVEPLIFGGPQAGNVIKASTWAVIHQSASPGVGPTIPDDFSAYIWAGSDTQDAYEGAAGSTKTLIKFDSVLPAGKTYEIVLWDTQAALGVTDRKHIQLSVNSTLISGTGYNGSGLQATFTLRWRPIIAAYTIAGLTWNSFLASPPTMDTERTAIWSESPFTFTTILTPPANVTISTVLQQKAPPLYLFAGVDIVGLVLDIKAVASSASAWALSNFLVALRAAAPGLSALGPPPTTLGLRAVQMD